MKCKKRHKKVKNLNLTEKSVNYAEELQSLINTYQAETTRQQPKK